MDDVLSSLLKAYRLQATIYLHPQFCSPFSVDNESEPHLFFHLVESGSCYIEGQDGVSHLIAAGDIVVLPNGSSHRLFDISDTVEGALNSVSLVCGYFELDAAKGSPLLDALPDVMIIRAHQLQSVAGTEHLLRLMLLEMNQPSSGTQAIADSLAKILFIYVLRAWQLLQTDSNTGFLAALSDPRLSKALNAFHENFCDQWSLEKLAESSNMSRTAFAKHFAETVGLTPMAYVHQWRLQWVYRQLLESNAPIGDIAFNAGFQSEAAFSRAFKKHFGQSPSQVRKQT